MRARAHPWRPERVLDPLELQLQMVWAGQLMGARRWVLILEEQQALLSTTHLSSQPFLALLVTVFLCLDENTLNFSFLYFFKIGDLCFIFFFVSFSLYIMKFLADRCWVCYSTHLAVFIFLSFIFLSGVFYFLPGLLLPPPVFYLCEGTQDLERARQLVYHWATPQSTKFAFKLKSLETLEAYVVWLLLIFPFILLRAT